MRTIRISHEVDEALRSDAKLQGVSINNLVQTILAKYAQWDRHAAKFDFVSMSRPVMKALFDCSDDLRLIETAENLGPEVIGAVTLFWFGKKNVKNFFAVLSLLSKYSQAFLAEHEIDGRHCKIMLRSNLGPNFTLFITHFLAAAIERLIGAAPKIETSENSLTFEFDLP